MIIYLFFLVLTFLPLIEGEFLGIGHFVLLAGCLPLSIYLYKKKIILHKINLLFLGFIFFAALATIFSPAFSRSLEKLILYLAYFIYFLAAQVLVKEDKKQFRQLLTVSLLFPSLILSLLSFYFLFTGQPPPFKTSNLLFANFGHNHVIDLLIFAFPLNLALLARENDKFKRGAYLLMNLLFLASFVFSFSRGGILMALFIMLLFKLFTKKTKNLNKSQAIVPHLLNFSILLLAFALIFAVLGYYYLGEDKIKAIDSLILRKVFRESPIQIRIEYWRQSIAAFAKRPILGWGLDSFRYTSKMFQRCVSCWSWYAHNHFLQMFAETGIFGGLSFLALIYLIFKKIQLFNKNSDFFNMALKIGLLTSAIHSLFDYDWQMLSVFLFFWIIAAYLCNHKKNSKKPSHKLLLLARGRGFNIVILGLGFLLFSVAVLQLTANLYLFFGANKAEQENFKTAEKYYQKSLSLWPFKLENWWTPIRFYEERQEVDLASNALKKLIKLEPLHSSALQLLAELNLKKYKKELAVQNYYQAFFLMPADLQTAFKLIDFLEKEPDLLTIDQIYLLLEQIEKHNNPKCILKCLEFENEKKIENLLLQLISAQGGSALGRKQDQFSQLNQGQQARIYFWLAVLTTYQEDWDQNVIYVEQAINLDGKKEYQEFLTDLLLVKEIQVNYWQSNFAVVKELSSKFDPKIKNHAFHEKFYLARVYVFLSEINYKEGNSEQGEKYYQQALEINPWLQK